MKFLDEKIVKSKIEIKLKVFDQCEATKKNPKTKIIPKKLYVKQH